MYYSVWLMDCMCGCVVLRLYEYEAKEIVARYGVPVPRGRVARSREEAVEAARELGRVVVKAQVLVGRRGLAGGVVPADTPEEAGRAAEKLLGSSIRGFPVESVLIEERVCFEKEYYLSLTVDRSARSYVYLVSPLGGVEIEELVREHPEKLLKIHFSPYTGYQPYMSRMAAVFLGLEKEHWGLLDRIMSGMYRVMRDLDTDLVEFNPLAYKCGGGGLVALDAKITIDDNSLYRHTDLAEKYGREMSPLEARAKRLGFSYVELDGDIGVICNGAGLTMATMDMILYYGGRPANFLDIGGGADRSRVREAIKLVLSNPRVRVLLLNIFGGITRCDEVALGVVDALGESERRVPVVVRMLGTNEDEGRRILEEHGFNVYSEADEAVEKAVELSKG